MAIGDNWKKIDLENNNISFIISGFKDAFKSNSYADYDRVELIEEISLATAIMDKQQKMIKELKKGVVI